MLNVSASGAESNQLLFTLQSHLAILHLRRRSCHTTLSPVLSSQITLLARPFPTILFLPQSLLARLLLPAYPSPLSPNKTRPVPSYQRTLISVPTHFTQPTFTPVPSRHIILTPVSSCQSLTYYTAFT